MRLAGWVSVPGHDTSTQFAGRPVFNPTVVNRPEPRMSEGDLIRDRVIAGVPRAKAQGRGLGRPRKHHVDVARARGR